MKMIPRFLAIVALAALCACGSDADPPDRDPVGPSDLPSARRIKRLTADQFHRSLQIATGQSWSRYGQFAEAMGRADFGEVTDEGTDLTVTFDKLVHDAARETCRTAVTADVAGGTVVLRHVRPSDRDPALIATNLQYLFLRFLGIKIDTADDPRLAPWIKLLAADPAPTTDAAMALRWQAVCVGLVTHTDFLTY